MKDRHPSRVPAMPSRLNKFDGHDNYAAKYSPAAEHERTRFGVGQLVQVLLFFGMGGLRSRARPIVELSRRRGRLGGGAGWSRGFSVDVFENPRQYSDPGVLPALGAMFVLFGLFALHANALEPGRWERGAKWSG